MKAPFICTALFMLSYGASGQSADTVSPIKRQFDPVVIKGRKPLFQQLPFRTVVNVGSSILSKGSTALQLLERSPGVTVDYRYNSIALNGRSGVTVMLDGKIHAHVDRSELPKNKGTFQLSITDIFKTVKYKNYYGSLTPDAFDGHSWDVYNPESRQAQLVKLTYIRSFGAGAGKSQHAPDTGSQDEQNRVRKN